MYYWNLQSTKEDFVAPCISFLVRKIALMQQNLSHIPGGIHGMAERIFPAVI